MNKGDESMSLTPLPSQSFDGIVSTIESWNGDVAALPVVTAAIHALDALPGEEMQGLLGLTKSQRRKILDLFWTKFVNVYDPVPVAIPSGSVDYDAALSEVDGLSYAIMQTGLVSSFMLPTSVSPQACLELVLAARRQAKTMWRLSSRPNEMLQSLPAELVHSDLAQALAANDSLWLSAYMPAMWVAHSVVPNAVAVGLAAQDWMTMSSTHGVSIYLDRDSAIGDYQDHVVFFNASIGVHVPPLNGSDVLTQFGVDINETWFVGNVGVNKLTNEITTENLRRN